MPTRPWTLVAYSDSAVVGGAEISLANVLAALGPEVRLVLMGDRPAVLERIARDARPARIEVLQALSGIRDLRGMAAHMRAFRRHAPCIVQVNMPASWFALYAALAAVLTPGVRTVLVEHAPAPMPSRRHWRIKRFVARRSAAHVAVGHRSAGIIEADLRLAPGSIDVVHNGVRGEAVTPLPRLRPGPVVGGVGRLEPEKGFDVLVAALAQMPAVHAAIVGDGGLRAALEAQATELAVRDRLTLCGWLEHPRPRSASFDAFVLPSRTESFPLTVLEAMLDGVPVIATDVGSVSEAVEHEVTGLLVPEGNPKALAAAVRRILEEPGLADRLRDGARRRALNRFTVERMSAGYQAVYRRVL